MRELGLRGVRRGKRGRTTIPDPARRRPAELVRRLVSSRGLSLLGVAGEQVLAVVAAEQEDEAVQVVAQLRDAVGGVADALGEQGLQQRFGGEPFAEEGQHLGELAGVVDVELYLGHGSGSPSRRTIRPCHRAGASQQAGTRGWLGGMLPWRGYVSPA